MEERISELKDKSDEVLHSDRNKEKNNKECTEPTRSLNIIQRSNICIIGILEGKKLQAEGKKTKQNPVQWNNRKFPKSWDGHGHPGIDGI